MVATLSRGVISPDPAAADRYERLYALYREAYNDTVTISHTLAAMQERIP